MAQNKHEHFKEINEEINGGGVKEKLMVDHPSRQSEGQTYNHFKSIFFSIVTGIFYAFCNALYSLPAK